MDYLGEFIAMGIDALIFGLCVKQYYKNKGAITMIKGAPYLEIDKDLAEIVNTHPEKKLNYVSVRGVVQPVGKPITSSNNSTVSGVVQQLSIKEHVVQRSTAGFWSDQERVIQEVNNVMPFVISNKHTHIEVVDPLAAEILDLDVISDVFSPTTPTVMDHLWGFFTGVRQRGVQTVESMLRVGSVITGIGELVPVSKDSLSGRVERPTELRLQPPSNGAPFFLTNMELSSLVRKLDDSRRNYRVLCIVFSTIGVFIGGLIVRRYLRERRARIDKLSRSRELEVGRKERRRRVRDEDLPEIQLCIVCKDHPREIILLPCGHVCLCEDCSEGIKDNCPVCRALISSKSVAYIT